jgi:3-hydroxybutyryl-CoA dehydrogenase
MSHQDGFVGVVGAGFMGSGIAESAARGGFDVVVHEPEAAPLERSRDRIQGIRGSRARCSSSSI